MSRAKKDTDKQQSLPEQRLKEYELFRHNLALLRANSGLSGSDLSKELGFKKHYRAFDLEVGRATMPKIDEVKAIATYFKISIDQLLFHKAIISFTNP